MTRLTRTQVREIDRRSRDDYGIPTLVLMENAARAVAETAAHMIDDNCVGEILILCGTGNNAGDGLAAARHLHNRGADVTLALLFDPNAFKGDALLHWQVSQKMGITAVRAVPTLFDDPAMLVIDAIFGTGLNRPPADPFPALVQALKNSRHPVLSIDLPSGLDCDTGLPLGACIQATRTLTFVAEKSGFANPEARKYLGQVTTADIGSPKELVDQLTHP